MSAPKEQRGFTLIELMVTIAIIAIIASVGLVVYSSAQKTGRISKRVQDLIAIKTALELYKTSTGAYPAQNGWFCISTALSILTPNHMLVLPADPLDGGDAGGANCYQYTSGVAGDVTSEYKVRTNPRVAAAASGPEMSSANFAQQPTFLDPAKDGTVNCTVETGSGITYSGWAASSGSIVCDD